MNLAIAISRHKDVHERILPSMVATLTEQDLTKSFHHLNPVLWILWHMARTEDFGINKLARDGTQEFTTNDWDTKLGTNTLKMGTGMSKDEVKEICQRLNHLQLENYRLAVFHNNLKVVEKIKSEDLSTCWNDDYLNKVLFTEGILDRSTTNILPVYQNKTRE